MGANESTSGGGGGGSRDVDRKSSGGDGGGDGDGKTCHSCGQDLGTVYVNALGRNYHREHFVCHTCACELADESFFEHNGLTYCTPHYEEAVAKRCHRCSQPIVSGRIFSALGREFHEQCFRCARCDNQLDEAAQFYAELKQADGDDDKENASGVGSKSQLQVFCKVCKVKQWKKTGETAVCGWCEMPVEEEGVIAGGQNWHKECFVCTECQTNLLNTGDFFEVDGRVFCRQPSCVFDRAQRGTKRKRSWFDFLPFRNVRQKRDHPTDEQVASASS